MEAHINSSLEPKPCSFNQFKRYYVPVKENWFQGQLNFISSAHVGVVELWELAHRNKFKDDEIYIQKNVHSDDGQLSVGQYGIIDAAP